MRWHEEAWKKKQIITAYFSFVLQHLWLGFCGFGPLSAVRFGVKKVG